jgi:hypothetical protein
VHDARRVQLLNIQIKGFALRSTPRETQNGRAEVDDARTLENTLFGLFRQFIPQRLGAKHQRNIAFTFAISMANETGIAMMAAFRMRRKVGIDHQDVQTCLCCVIACGRTNGAAANND